MTDTFGARAAALCGLAARALSWRPHEFWVATPSELAAALAPPDSGPGEGLARADLQRMMDNDNG